MVTKLKLSLILIEVLSLVVLKTETLVYDGTTLAPSIIECKDASTPCLINCTVDGSCKEKEIHCHRTAQQPCTIHVGTSDLRNVGRDSFYYTHRAPTVHITAIGLYALFHGVMYAHEAIGSQLYLSVSSDRVFEGSTLYAPVGEGSLLSMHCSGDSSCRGMRIYEDWTTEVHIVAESIDDNGYGFVAAGSVIRNIFDDSPLNISRNDTNYIGLNSSYRAPVFLTNSDRAVPTAFSSFQYFGHNHGDWTLHGTGLYAFSNAYIEATADIPPHGGYDIKLIGTSLIDNGNDSLTDALIFSSLTLNASHGANIYVEVTDTYGLTNAAIYAKKANSVQIYCKEGGDCDGLMVECPQSNSACTILCDDADTDCSNMKIYTHACSD
eukprot:669373_1